MPIRRTFAPLVALALVAVLGCSGDGNESADATDPPGTDGDAAELIDAVAATDGAGEVDDAAGVAATDAPDTDPPATDESTTTIGIVPDTGVPGIDSGDLFCRSWSRFAGSFQALALAASFGVDDVEATRSEVVASPALIAAVEGLDTGLPAELESERSTLVVDLVGPMTRRAEQARAELVAAGLTDEEIEALGDAWLVTLAEEGVDDPDLFVEVDGVDEAAVDAAVAAFGAALPPIDEDPSLITDAQVPLTEQFLLENCPDQGTLGGNDVIDS